MTLIFCEILDKVTSLGLRQLLKLNHVSSLEGKSHCACSVLVEQPHDRGPQRMPLFIRGHKPQSLGATLE